MYLCMCMLRILLQSGALVYSQMGKGAPIVIVTVKKKKQKAPTRRCRLRVIRKRKLHARTMHIYQPGRVVILQARPA